MNDARIAAWVAAWEQLQAATKLLKERPYDSAVAEWWPPFPSWLTIAVITAVVVGVFALLVLVTR